MEEKEKLKKGKTAGLFMHLCELSFAGMVIGGMVSIPSGTVDALSIAKVIVGGILSIVFARIGFIILK